MGPQEGDPGRLELLLGRARPAGDHVEHLDDRGALGGLVLGVPAADALRGDPGLPVRRTGQRDDPRAGQDGVLDLDGVTGRPDVRVRGPHVAVDLDPAPWSELDAGIDRQLRVRPDTRGHDHQGRLEEPATGQLDGEQPGLVGRERSGRGAQVQGDPMGPQVVLHGSGELLVQRRHDLVGHLHDLDGQAALVQVLGHLQADVAGADDDHVLEAVGARGDRVDLGLDARPCPRCCAGHGRPGGPGRAAAGGSGEDPGHSASLSHVSVYSSPVIRSRAVTVRATGSIAVTSVVTRTSMSRVSRRLCGVCRSRRERSLIVSPMWYGRPQLANETLPDFSNTMISANSSSRRVLAATDAPAATPPTTTSFMSTPVLVA